MSLVGLLVSLAIIGAALYLVNTVIPMDQKIRKILNVVVVVVVCLWLVDVFFGLGPILNRGPRVGRVG